MTAFDRRTFVKTVAGAAVAGFGVSAASPTQSSGKSLNQPNGRVSHEHDAASIPEKICPQTPAVSSSGYLLPAALKKGSKVALAAPASGIAIGDIRSNVEMLKGLGLEIVLGEEIYKKNGYLSAPDEKRAAEFMQFVEDDSIDCILCARGGYGVMRILPYLDFDVIRNHPKIIIGYSDITALLIAIANQSGLVTYHGPVASSEFDTYTKFCFLQSLYPDAADAAFPKKDGLDFKLEDKVVVISPGKASGRLTGGNLSMIVSTLGTPYEIQTQNAILFLEEIEEEPYKIDRMLTQLWLAGKLQSCNGFALGRFKNCERKSRSAELPSSLRETLSNRLAALGKPVLYGLPFGHVKSKMTLPLGVSATLDSDSKTIRLDEPSVFS